MLDSIADARDELVDALHAATRSSAATAVLAVGLHAHRPDNGVRLRVLGANVCASEQDWNDLLPCTELQMPALLKDEGMWHSVDKSGLPDRWLEGLTARGGGSVAIAGVQTPDGLAGLILYVNRQRRERSAVEMNGGRVSTALIDLRTCLAQHLTPPCMLVWGADTMLGASRPARRWVDVFGHDFASAYRRCRPTGESATLLSGVVALQSIALVGSAHFVTNLDLATPVPLIATVGLANRPHQAAVLGAGGASVPEIAEQMGISTETVRGYLKDVYRELGVANRVELARSLGRLD